MKKGAATAMLLIGATLGGAGGALVGTSPLRGTAYVHFELQLPDGGVRDLGRTGCYELGEKVKATVEACEVGR